MIAKRHKLQCYGHVSCSSRLAKTILQGTVKGGRRQGRQRKRWEDNIREWTGLEFSRSQRAVENGKMEKTGCEIICGVPMTLAVKGQMRGEEMRENCRSIDWVCQLLYVTLRQIPQCLKRTNQKCY